VIDVFSWACVLLPTLMQVEAVLENKPGRVNLSCPSEWDGIPNYLIFAIG
jgi:hypothetical protein